MAVRHGSTKLTLLPCGPSSHPRTTQSDSRTSRLLQKNTQALGRLCTRRVRAMYIAKRTAGHQGQANLQSPGRTLPRSFGSVEVSPVTTAQRKFVLLSDGSLRIRSMKSENHRGTLATDLLPSSAAHRLPLSFLRQCPSSTLPRARPVPHKQQHKITWLG